MKRLLLLVSMFALVSIGYSQTDAKAKQLLDKTSNLYKSYKTIATDFVIVNFDPKGKALSKKSGNMKTKGTKFNILLGDTEIFSDGKYVYTVSKDINEITKTPVEDGNKGFTPQKIFTNFYDKDFLYRYNGSSTVDNEKVEVIELTPKDKSNNFFKISVEISTKTNHILGMKFYNKDGTQNKYEIKNTKGNTGVSDASFIYDKNKYPGFELIEL